MYYVACAAIGLKGGEVVVRGSSHYYVLWQYLVTGTLLYGSQATYESGKGPGL